MYRQLSNMLVLSCAGGAMEVMENVFDCEECEAWRRRHHAYDPRLPDDVQGCSLT